VKFFVIFDAGSCNEGDHLCGWKTFDTFAEAEAERKRILATTFEATAFIIHGREVRDEPESRPVPFLVGGQPTPKVWADFAGQSLGGLLAHPAAEVNRDMSGAIPEKAAAIADAMLSKYRKRFEPTDPI
jgi:hypothetical protein